MSKIACLFPGQGSQSVGMGKDLYDNLQVAKDTFAAIDEIAGRSLSQLCFEGPEAELKRTVNTQPTILAVSLAAWKCYQDMQGPKPAFVAGHSLGEFTALVAADALSLEDVVPLVSKRAELMENCPSGAMSAVMSVAPEKLQEICAETTTELGGDEVVIVANFNTREQLVISGSPKAVAAAGEKAKAAGGKVIPLPVGGAFHSPLMMGAAEVFFEELKKYLIADVALPVVQNYDALPSATGVDLKVKLGRQMSNSVRWYESIEYMLSQGVDTFIEIGPGKALTGMVKRINKSARLYNVFDTESLKATVSALAQNVAV